MSEPILFIFIDGLGINPGGGENNPLLSGEFPVLDRIVHQLAVPIDACLGVEGIPQSATGHTAIYTGVNASAELGFHLHAYPNARLREIICSQSIFHKLIELGKKPAFANAYRTDDIEELLTRRHLSATSVMAISALKKVRSFQDMRNGEAVYHDITCETLAKPLCHELATTPEEAAKNISKITQSQDFTLFEFFLSDHAGHKRKQDIIIPVLTKLEAFMAELLQRAKNGEFLMIVTSDHGNLEDLSTSSHTKNRVPFAAIGPNAEFFKDKVKSLTDITPAVLEFLG